MAYADVTDVTVRLGRAVTGPLEEDQIEAWLDDAEGLITERIKDLADRIADGRLLESTVIRIEAQAVERKVKNPDGKQNERIDDYSYGLVEEAARGSVFITDGEWEELLGVSGGGGGAFTIRPGFPRLSNTWPLPGQVPYP